MNQVLTGVSITWPQATNGNLNKIKFDGTTIYNTSTGGGSLTIRRLAAGHDGPADDQRGCKPTTCSLRFQNNVNTNAANYTGSATFNPFGPVTTLP